MKINASVNDISMDKEKINTSVNDISMDKEKLKDVVKNHEY